ncbi:MAG: hypothetical protein JRK53_07275 [Deltaproteobacteria bacterium]|nr:hypothetical protein [Deltaproteobacteria bacterium]MBW1819291.1 hypothetical protein [Deltaproteobacteria bacterium]
MDVIIIGAGALGRIMHDFLCATHRIVAFAVTAKYFEQPRLLDIPVYRIEDTKEMVKSEIKNIEFSLVTHPEIIVAG